MPYNRKAYAPFSQSAEAGITQAPVDGFIEVEQYVKPVIQAGTLGTDGKWLIAPQSDDSFIGLSKAEGIPNGADVLFPDTNNHPSINMKGFNDLVFAFKPTNGGNYTLKTVMGPDTVPYANLSPVNAVANIQIVHNPANDNLVNALNDTLSAGANVWNIVSILDGRCKDQINLQIEIGNSSGDASNIDFAFMRLV